MTLPYALQVQRKIVLVGYRGVGKTALATRFVEGQWLSSYDAGIANTFRKTMPFRKLMVSMDVVDTAGLVELPTTRLSRNALIGVHGYILMYSITSRISFEKLPSINDAVLHMLGDSPIPRVLVGAQADSNEHRQVSTKEGQVLARALGNLPCIECSAKSDLNVAEVFTLLLKEIEDEQAVFQEYQPSSCIVV